MQKNFWLLVYVIPIKPINMFSFLDWYANLNKR